VEAFLFFWFYPRPRGPLLAAFHLLLIRGTIPTFYTFNPYLTSPLTLKV